MMLDDLTYKIRDFDYELPQELIAQTPIEPRDASRLLVVHRDSEIFEHRYFRDIGEYLRPGDLLIANQSRVLPARLLGQRAETGGAVEVLLLAERLDLRSAARHDAALDTFAPLPAPLHERAPLFSVRRGRVVVLAFVNRTEHSQSIHLHGHHVRLLDRLDDGWKPYWLDTLTIAARQTDRVAFLADNPGKWLIEAQALRDSEARTGAWFTVT